MGCMEPILLRSLTGKLPGRITARTNGMEKTTKQMEKKISEKKNEPEYPNPNATSDACSEAFPPFFRGFDAFSRLISPVRFCKILLFCKIL